MFSRLFLGVHSVTQSCHLWTSGIFSVCKLWSGLRSSFSRWKSEVGPDANLWHHKCCLAQYTHTMHARILLSYFPLWCCPEYSPIHLFVKLAVVLHTSLRSAATCCLLLVLNVMLLASLLVCCIALRRRPACNKTINGRHAYNRTYSSRAVYNNTHPGLSATQPRTRLASYIRFSNKAERCVLHKPASLLLMLSYIQA